MRAGSRGRCGSPSASGFRTGRCAGAPRHDGHRGAGAPRRPRPVFLVSLRRARRWRRPLAEPRPSDPSGRAHGGPAPSAPGTAMVPTCYGWSAPYPFGFDDHDDTRFFIPFKFAPQAARLAAEVRKHAAPARPCRFPSCPLSWTLRGRRVLRPSSTTSSRTAWPPPRGWVTRRRSRSWPGPATSERPGVRT